MTLAAYGCGSGPNLLDNLKALEGPTIVGNWRAVEGTATVSFAADGVFHAVDNQGMPVTGNYRLMGADGIQFEIRHGGEKTETVDARVIQAGERLTLTFPGENALETYERIP
jgi:hypothetical protein